MCVCAGWWSGRGLCGWKSPNLSLSGPPLAPAVQGRGWGMMVTHVRAGARRLSALMHAWCLWTEDRPGWAVSVWARG